MTKLFLRSRRRANFLLLAQWGRMRLLVACEVLDPKRKGRQNIIFRQMLRHFQPPAWRKRVVVLEDAGFASKPNLRLIQRLKWRFVFALPRAWELEVDTHLRDLAGHLPKSRYRRVASYREKGYEALYLTEPVDELLAQSLWEYEGRRLKSVGKGDAKFGGSEEEKEKAQAEIAG